jgi:hypothetical protein
MVRKTLIENLNRVFCNLSKRGRLYSRVWLEEFDFGGLYQSGKYVLHVQAHPTIENRFREIEFIIYHLDATAKAELNYIWHVSVQRNDRNAYYEQDLIVYEEAASGK